MFLPLSINFHYNALVPSTAMKRSGGGRKHKKIAIKKQNTVLLLKWGWGRKKQTKKMCMRRRILSPSFFSLPRDAISRIISRKLFHSKKIKFWTAHVVMHSFRSRSQSIVERKLFSNFMMPHGNLIFRSKGSSKFVEISIDWGKKWC